MYGNVFLYSPEIHHSTENHILLLTSTAKRKFHFRNPFVIWSIYTLDRRNLFLMCSGFSYNIATTAVLQHKRRFDGIVNPVCGMPSEQYVQNKLEFNIEVRSKVQEGFSKLVKKLFSLFGREEW